MHSCDTSEIIKENNRIIVLMLLTHGRARVALSMSSLLNRTYNSVPHALVNRGHSVDHIGLAGLIVCCERTTLHGRAGSFKSGIMARMKRVGCAKPPHLSVLSFDIESPTFVQLSIFGLR